MVGMSPVSASSSPSTGAVRGSCAEAAGILGVHDVTVAKDDREGLLHGRAPRQHDRLNRPEIEPSTPTSGSPGIRTGCAAARPRT
jgi:hypothetical protein